MLTITPDYLKEQQGLHARDDAYGSRGFHWMYLVAGIALFESCKRVLDYGCGKGSLGLALRSRGIACADYDPAVPQFAKRPGVADLVVCTDVLEHIEPDCIDTVIKDLCALTGKILFVNVCMRDAGRTLSDGRNAHILIRDKAWWRKKFEDAGMEVRRDWPSPGNDNLWIAMMQRKR